MKKIMLVLFALGLVSCAGILSKKDVFIGDWVMSESSPGYGSNQDKHLKIEIKISKEDIFYKVEYIMDGKSLFGSIFPADKITKEVTEGFSKYQLSPDKRFLFAIGAPSEFVIMYNDDNNTITTPYGWFRKK